MAANPIAKIVGVLAFGGVVAVAAVAMAQPMPPYAQPAPGYGGPPPSAVNTPAVAPPAPAPGARYRGDSFAPIVDLNLRAAPSDDAPVIGTLPQGVPVHVQASTPSGWFQVDSEYGTGWAYSRYLAPS